MAGLKNKTVFITGATSGIGKATAKLFGKRGYNLIITGRREKLLRESKETYERKYAVPVKVLPFDIRDKSAVTDAYNSLSKSEKQIDILINNAGLAKGKDPIHEGQLDHWETMIDTNIKGLLFISRLVIPFMVKRKKGHIINVCSTAGYDVYPNGNVYCATKFAVDALTKGMRLDLFKHNVKVSQISPAHVEETDFAKRRFDGDESKAKIYEDFNPLTSRDVAKTIYFIASRPRHVNIQDIVMMGVQQATNSQINRTGRIYDKK